jgi:hypothetical protein
MSDIKEQLRQAIVQASYDYWYENHTLGCDTRGDVPAGYVAEKLFGAFDVAERERA